MRNIFFFALFFLVSSCKEAQQTKFSNNGVSLTCPTGWEITDQENLDGVGYYLSIEKQSFDASGLVTLTWINGEMDLSGWIDDHKEELLSNSVFQDANLSFGKTHQSQLNTIETIAVDYTASIFGLEHRGTIHFFFEKDKTFSYLIQEAVEDKTDNKKGLEIIEESLHIQ